jgi:hypothetical protein
LTSAARDYTGRRMALLLKIFGMVVFAAAVVVIAVVVSGS